MKFMDTWADSPDRCHRIANLMFYEDLSLEDAVEKERSEQLLYDTPRDQIELRHQVNLEWESNYSIDLTESFDALEERQSFAHATSPAKDDQSAFGKNDVHVRVRTIIESAVSDWEDISDTSISEVASPKHPQATNTDVGRQHLGYLDSRSVSRNLNRNHSLNA